MPPIKDRILIGSGFCLQNKNKSQKNLSRYVARFSTEIELIIPQYNTIVTNVTFFYKPNGHLKQFSKLTELLTLMVPQIREFTMSYMQSRFGAAHISISDEIGM